MKTEIIKLLVLMAQLYNKNLTENIIEVYCDILEELSSEELNRAFKKIMKDPNQRFFPLPAEILQAAKEDSRSNKDLAMEVVSKIFYAISKIGPYRSKEARDHIGEIGWEVIQREGGWEFVNEILNESNSQTIKAQWRDTIQSFQTKQKDKEISEKLKLTNCLGLQKLSLKYEQ